MILQMTNKEIERRFEFDLNCSFNNPNIVFFMGDRYGDQLITLLENIGYEEDLIYNQNYIISNFPDTKYDIAVSRNHRYFSIRVHDIVAGNGFLIYEIPEYVKGYDITCAKI